MRELLLGDDKSAQSEEQQEIMAPEPEQFQLRVPKDLANVDKNIIKHCAQFVALNGQSFLQELTLKHSKNAQFDFLKPTNPLFEWFTDLVEIYSKCLNPEISTLESYA